MPQEFLVLGADWVKVTSSLIWHKPVGAWAGVAWQLVFAAVGDLHGARGLDLWQFEGEVSRQVGRVRQLSISCRPHVSFYFLLSWHQ